MKRLSTLYQATLQAYFEQGSVESLLSSHELGNQAVTFGLDTLDMARIHDHALDELLAPDRSATSRDELIRRAEIFFTEAITPLEKTHRIALETNANLQQLSSTLQQRTLDLADSHSVLQEQITGRRQAETTLKNSQLDSSQLLKESRLLEKHLQGMARKILSSTETERKTMSCLLNDEIAQTLLGIKMRMLALKKEVATHHADISREITLTQRLVEDSAIIIRRLAHEFSTQHER